MTTITALLLMLAFDPIVHLSQASFLLFFGAVTLTALYGGRNPAIVATVLAAVFANYFFLGPKYQWTMDLASSIRMLLFLGQGILISVLVGALRTAQEQAQKSLKQLQASEIEIKTLNQELQHQVDELTVAERTLRASEERLRVALKNAPIAVFNQNTELVYTWIYNPTFDYQVDQVVGKRDRDLVPEKDALLLDRIKGGVLATGVGVREEVKLTIDGEIYHYDLTVEPLQNEQGVVIGVTCAAIDVTKRKQAEESLWQSEQRFRQLVESNMFGVAFSRANGEMYYANDYFLNMVGYTREDLKAGRIQWLDMTPPEFRLLDEQANLELQEFGVATPFEKEYIRKDGSRVPILVGVTLSQEPSDHEQESICFYIDLTERKRVEVAWQEDKQILDALMEYIPEGITIADAPDVIIRKVSKHGQQLVGRPLERLEGTTASTHVDDWGIFRADGIARPTEDELPLTRAVRQSEVVVNEEWVVQQPDGGKISILCNAGPIHDAKGNTTGGILAWRDITERKQAEERLRQALQKLTFHVENTPIAVIEWNRDFRITRWSGAAERILGWSSEEVLGKPLADLHFVYEDDMQEVTDVCERLALGEEPFIFSYNRNYTKNRDVVHCEWYNSSLRDTNGQMLSVLSLVLDVTDRKQVETEREQLLARERAARTEAEAANRVKDEFLAVLSHELRSPLNPILGWSRLLQTKKLDEAKVTEALKTIERNARLQAELIEDLLDVSRILQGKLTLNLSAIDLSTTIQAAIETVRLAAEAKAIHIETELQPGSDPIVGDASRLQQIVWNLLSNAVKFTPSGGRVHIRLQQAGSQAQIIVSDTGKGISPEFLPHVFEYFRQADSSTTRKFGGLGLGLAIVRHLVELHGGTIQAESPGEGLGATFTVQLPLMARVAATSQRHVLPKQRPNLNGIKVLVVDDDPDGREFVAFLLEQEMATVITVASAHEALTTLLTVKPNILLSDIGMPDTDGYTFIQKVRSLPPQQGGMIPAIALTAYASEFDQQLALQAGFQKHISKPIEPDALIQAIIDLVGVMAIPE
ncbi:PAS domain S-box protein [Leptolyngbya sp. PL-A3]